MTKSEYRAGGGQVVRITIEGAQFGPSWETLEKLVQSMRRDNDATFTRISRDDGGGNYRAPGNYTLTVETAWGEPETITLSVR